MIIRTLSKTRGITMLYDGTEYIIWSDVYGIVAQSTNVERSPKQVEIHFDICEWVGYWDLKSIISRGITKFENEYVPKTMIYHWNTIKGEQMHLNRMLNIKTEKY